ncbi:MAG: hypothetical protein GX837_12525 [Methanomicrobiales archaeon]|nr:hypothetical protein [Methanomicrobiales archaeon]
MSMTTHGYNYDLAIREVGDQVTVTNNLGRTAIYGEIVLLGGMYGIVMEHDGIANGATGRIYVLQPDTLISTAQINPASTFVAGAAIYFKAGSSSAAGTLEDAEGGVAVAIGTIESAVGAPGAHTSVSFRPYSQIVDYGGYDDRLTAVESVTNGLTKDPGIPFRKTVTLTSALATTAVEIIPDADVAAGKCVYINSLYANVDGNEVWDGSGSVVKVQDTAGVAAITFAKGQLTADAQLAFLSNGVTLGDGIKDGTGMTPAKGLEIVADGTFETTGSDLIVTITGFIGNVPA